VTWNDLIYIAPEIILTIGASLLLVMPVIKRGSDRSAKVVMLALLAVTAASVIVCSNVVVNIDQSRQLQSMFALDAFSIFFKLLFIAVIALITLLSEDFLAEARAGSTTRCSPSRSAG
jgi:NADH:ubiquinone oxidoreductase subunit 2 (subunit N)